MKTSKIRSFKDLHVFQSSYSSSIVVITQVVSKLPREEQKDLGDQLRRAAKAVPRLIAEGFAKRQQRRGFQKYLYDAIAESNEMIVSLSHARDLYSDYVDVRLCEKLIDSYDKTSRQLLLLRKKWETFKEK
jgi:four helix bundle protein